MRPHAMTHDEAVDITEVLTQRWPHPELGKAGLDTFIVGVLDTGLTYDEALGTIRVLQQQHHDFRPEFADMTDVAGRNRPAYHRPYLVTTNDPLTPHVTAQHIAAARAALRGNAS